jgi:hypothetical protein
MDFRLLNSYQYFSHFRFACTLPPGHRHTIPDAWVKRQ